MTAPPLRIAVIAGDGIGTEVIPAGIAVLEQAVRRDDRRLAFTELPWGCDHYRRTGHMMDADGLEQLQDFDAIYLGAIGAPGVPDDVSLDAGRDRRLEPVR
jgi:tartrate dehydrogenase/decarboxylase/D-malate dehydrogenase